MDWGNIITGIITGIISSVMVTKVYRRIDRDRDVGLLVSELLYFYMSLQKSMRSNTNWNELNEFVMNNLIPYRYNWIKMSEVDKKILDEAYEEYDRIF